MEAARSAKLGVRKKFMIDRREILDTATRVSLSPHVVEKDYVLGWLRAGIYAHEALTESWIFKGGTCLKKCFFETYRFSEDLDFTLRDGAHLDAEFLQQTFAEIGEWIYETAGIEMPAEKQDFEFFTNPLGNLACQGKISYAGPISPRSGGWPRIKLDLTASERVVMEPVRVPVFHPYSDVPEEGIEVLAYDYVEAFAEKFRALAESTRPRDLYDVVNLYRNTEALPDQTIFAQVLREKCAFKVSSCHASPILNRIASTSRLAGRRCLPISCRHSCLSIHSGMSSRRFSTGSTARPCLLLLPHSRISAAWPPSSANGFSTCRAA